MQRARRRPGSVGRRLRHTLRLSPGGGFLSDERWGYAAGRGRVEASEPVFSRCPETPAWPRLRRPRRFGRRRRHRSRRARPAADRNVRGPRRRAPRGAAPIEATDAGRRRGAASTRRFARSQRGELLHSPVAGSSRGGSVRPGERVRASARARRDHRAHRPVAATRVLHEFTVDADLVERRELDRAGGHALAARRADDIRVWDPARGVERPTIERAPDTSGHAGDAAGRGSFVQTGTPARVARV